MNPRIQFVDNTLREGEQVPGVCFSREEKLALFDALQDAGVDMIDLGVPASSPEVASFCAECARRAVRVQCGASVRALAADIDLAHSLGLRDIFLMFPFSEIHIKYKFASDTESIRRRCGEMIAHARHLDLNINLVGEDASRGSHELVCEFSRFAAEQGIDRLFLCDTVGAARPSVFGALVREVSDAVGSLCRIGVHCHNDFGLATANSMSAVEAGAECVSATVNGLGERAGNAALHEVVLALTLLDHLDHGLDLCQLPRLSEMVERQSGIYLSPLAPIVGLNAFRHESGIHIDGILKQSRVYEELRPEAVGRQRELVLGVSSGTHHMHALLRERGIQPTAALLRRLQRKLDEEIRTLDKNECREMCTALRRYYEERSGLALRRFWELVAMARAEEPEPPCS